ncbi:MAG: hypothetical protein A2V92_04375 [Candidatus Muproteobacteria bacterium RBG_16_65_31]|uniref:Porin domain-containing protein n=1 Tax=Candidatus Muproteobacteria bacterium RBG_16_65_31 TaxID=1817759 RepID=A0A1F6TGB5_9PROT|nr:MAG: hypothetical protein A2V92_04375 [Candidatus Muproteobacteria bacterium RBG_16_65_31]
MLRKLVFAVLAGYSAGVSADAMDINVSDETAQFVYATGYRTAELSFGALYNKTSKNWLGSASLLALGDQSGKGSRSEAGLGAKLYAASADEKDVLALGLGGQFRIFPGDGPLGVGGSAFYAPGVLNAGDATRFWEADVRVEYEVVKRTANAYIGYRKIRTKLDNGPEVDVDKGAHVGIRFSF